MKTIGKIVLPVLALFFAVSCESGPNQVEQDYEKLNKENDSLQDVHTDLQDSLQMLRSNHRELLQRLETADTVDSAHFEDMARHMASLEEMEATLTKHDELLQAYSELDQNRTDMSQEELKAQVDEMKDQQDEVKKGQDQIENNIENLRKDHENIRESLRSMNERKSEEGETSR